MILKTAYAGPRRGLLPRCPFLPSRYASGECEGPLLRDPGENPLDPTPLCVLSKMVEKVEEKWGDTPLPNRLQHSLQWWEKWVNPKIVTLIREGIRPQWQKPPHLSIQGRQGENLAQAQKFLVTRKAVQ